MYAILLYPVSRVVPLVTCLAVGAASMACATSYDPFADSADASQDVPSDRSTRDRAKPVPDDAPDDNNTPDVASDHSAPPDAPQETALDVTPDTAEDTEPDTRDDGEVDAPEDITTDTETDTQEDSPDGNDAEGGPPPSGTVVLRITNNKDAVASYLMEISPVAWNMFHGSSVSIGRHFDATMDNVSYHTGFRFTNVQIPPGVTITRARMRFYPTNEVDSSNNLWIKIFAERKANASPIDPSNYDAGRPDQRLATTHQIDRWLVRCNASCTDLTEYDCNQRKLDCWNRNVKFEIPKDLSAMVQEVVDLPEWQPGNAMMILLVNTATNEDGPKYKGHRSITTLDPERGADFENFAPELEISYETP